MTTDLLHPFNHISSSTSNSNNFETFPFFSIILRKDLTVPYYSTPFIESYRDKHSIGEKNLILGSGRCSDYFIYS